MIFSLHRARSPPTRVDRPNSRQRRSRGKKYVSKSLLLCRREERLRDVAPRGFQKSADSELLAKAIRSLSVRRNEVTVQSLGERRIFSSAEMRNAESRSARNSRRQRARPAIKPEKKGRHLRNKSTALITGNYRNFHDFPRYEAKNWNDSLSR